MQFTRLLNRLGGVCALGAIALAGLVIGTGIVAVGYLFNALF